MEKKAQSIIVWVVLMVMVLVMFSILFVKFDKGTKGLLDDEKCRAEVYAHAVALKMTGRMFETEVDCPTPPLKKLDSQDEDTKEWIAESMRKCWYSFGEGQLNLFKDEHLYCHACNVFTLENGNLEGMLRYMGMNEMPGSKQSYLEYLQGFKSDEAENIREVREKADSALSEHELDVFKEGTDYAVLFTYAKGQDKIKILWDQINPLGEKGGTRLGAGFIGGAIAGGFAYASAAATASTLSAIGLGALAVSPVGWGLAVAATVGVGIYGTWQAIDYFFFNDEAVPEWASFTILTELTPENLQAIGCEYEPIAINNE